MTGGVVVADVSDGTAAGLLAFLDWAGSRGEMNAGTAGSRAVAVRRVLEIENTPLESIDLRQLDVEDLLNRFETLKRLEYTSKSMDVYKSRVKNSIGTYLAWLDKRPDWKTLYRPIAGPAKDHNGNPRRKIAPRKPGETPANTSLSEDDQAGESIAAGPTGVTPMIPYEVPLRSGGELRARLVLPADLTRLDADRLCRFISSLAFELPAPSHNEHMPVEVKHNSGEA
jgi:hypothetical protein